MRLLALSLSLFAAAAYVSLQSPPDIAILNARVFTGVAAQPWVEAIAVRGERISAIGSSEAIRGSIGSQTRVIDAAGRLVIPGINDAHAHAGARPPATTLEGPPAVEHDPAFAEILERLKAAVARAPNGGWVFGEIGAATLDDAKATRFALDSVAPDHLVALTSWTGHGMLVNSAALRYLGIKEDQADPPGGFYARMPGTNTLTGMSHEYAEYLLRRRISMTPSAAAQVAAFQEFGRRAAALGITSVQLMMTSLAAADAARTFAAADLPQRIRVIDFPMTAISAWQRPVSASVRGSGHVRVSGTKWVIDGTPVERLMFIRNPYSDRGDTRGRLNFPAADITGFLRRALAAGEQPMLHAVGDAAIDTVLDGLEQTGAERWQPLRPRLEHGDMLEPSQFARAKRFGVVLVQNPSHFMIPGIFGPRLGPRVATVTLLRSTIAAGIPVALGSDGPLNPFLNVMFASINANNPAESMTREQALAAYTLGSAFAEFQENEKGAIAAGMLADLAVLSQDILTAPRDALPATTSVLTMVGGRVVHEQK